MKSLRSDGMACVLYRMRRLAPCLLLAACGHAAPVVVPPKQLPAATVAAIAGTWATSGELDWEYKMVITPAGTIAFSLDRGTAGRCDQAGTIAAKADHVFAVTYTRGDCNHDVIGHPLDLTVASFTGSQLEVEVAGQHRSYTFVPAP
jgi:hypothetical protein